MLTSHLCTARYNTKALHFAYLTYECVLYDPHYKQRLFPRTTLTDLSFWMVTQTHSVLYEVGTGFLYTVSISCNLLLNIHSWFVEIHILRFEARSQIDEKRMLASSCRPVYPKGTIRLPPNGFSWNFIFEYFFRKCVLKIKFSLKSDKNNGHFTQRPVYILDNISLNSS